MGERVVRRKDLLLTYCCLVNPNLKWLKVIAFFLFPAAGSDIWAGVKVGDSCTACSINLAVSDEWLGCPSFPGGISLFLKGHQLLG